MPAKSKKTTSIFLPENELMDLNKNIGSAIKGNDWPELKKIIESVLTKTVNKNEIIQRIFTKAILNSQPAIVNNIIKEYLKNIKVDLPGDEGSTAGSTPIMLAAFTGNCQTIQILLNAKADIHQTLISKAHPGVASGSTALYLAVQNNHFQAVQLIVNAGASVDNCFLKGFHVSTIAKISGVSNKLVGYLKKRMSNTLLIQKDGLTPFLKAISDRLPDFVKKLATPEEIQLLTQFGYTLTDFLGSMPHSEIMARLFKIRCNNIISRSVMGLDNKNIKDEKEKNELEKLIVKTVNQFCSDSFYKMDISEKGSIVFVGMQANISVHHATQISKAKILKEKIERKQKQLAKADGTRDVAFKDSDWVSFFRQLAHEVNSASIPFEMAVKKIFFQFMLPPGIQKLLRKEGMHTNFKNVFDPAKELIDPILEKLGYSIIKDTLETIYANFVEFSFHKDTDHTFTFSFSKSIDLCESSQGTMPPSLSNSPPCIHLTRENLEKSIAKILKICSSFPDINEQDTAQAVAVSLFENSEEFFSRTKEIQKMLESQYEINLKNIKNKVSNILKTKNDTVQEKIGDFSAKIESIKKDIRESNDFLKDINPDLVNIEKFKKANDVKNKKLIALIDKRDSIIKNFHALQAELSEKSNNLASCPEKYSRTMQYTVEPLYTNNLIAAATATAAADATVSSNEKSEYEIIIDNAYTVANNYDQCLTSLDLNNTLIEQLFTAIKRQRTIESKIQTRHNEAQAFTASENTEQLVETSKIKEKSMMDDVVYSETIESNVRRIAEHNAKIVNERDQAKKQQALKKAAQELSDSNLVNLSTTENKDSNYIPRKAPSYTLGGILRLDKRMNVHETLLALKGLLTSVNYSEAESNKIQGEQFFVIQYSLLGLSAILMEHIKKLNNASIFPYELAKRFRNNVFHHQYELIPSFNTLKIEELWDFNYQIKEMISKIIAFINDKPAHNKCRGNKDKIKEAIGSTLFNKIVDYEIPSYVTQSSKISSAPPSKKALAELGKKLKEHIKHEEAALDIIDSIKQTSDFNINEDILEHARNYAYARLGVHVSDYRAHTKYTINAKYRGYIEKGKALRHPSKYPSNPIVTAYQNSVASHSTSTAGSNSASGAATAVISASTATAAGAAVASTSGSITVQARTVPEQVKILGRKRL